MLCLNSEWAYKVQGTDAFIWCHLVDLACTLTITEIFSFPICFTPLCQCCLLLHACFSGPQVSAGRGPPAWTPPAAFSLGIFHSPSKVSGVWMPLWDPIQERRHRLVSGTHWTLPVSLTLSCLLSLHLTLICWLHILWLGVRKLTFKCKYPFWLNSKFALHCLGF